MPDSKNPVLVDDATERIGLLFRLRLPWLILGLVGGLLATQLVSRFEALLSQNLSLAFFIPLIVYMSDAIGTQTETIIVRSLSREKVNYRSLLVKELALGLMFGVTFALILGIIASVWLDDLIITRTVAIAVFVNLTIAPVIATLMTLLLQKYHSDPAASAGPFTTVIQDIVSLFIYFLVASYLIL
jgi:magnesium transporter